MKFAEILELISRGRTDFFIELMGRENWKDSLNQGPVRPLPWLVYFNDFTGLKSVIENGGTLESINLNEELGNAAFFGHWKVCDFLINHGADVNSCVEKTNETPSTQCINQSRQTLLFLCRQTI